MQLDSVKNVWAGRVTTWIIILAISCSMVFMSTLVAGPLLFSSDSVGRRVAVALYCPGAVAETQKNGPSTQTTSDPTGTYGHTVEITCTMPDGTERIISNEQYGIASIGSMFGGGALLGLLISLPLFMIPFFLFRRKKS